MSVKNADKVFAIQVDADNQVRILVSDWKGRTTIRVQTFFKSDQPNSGDGEYSFGKAVTIPLHCWAKFVKMVANADEAFAPKADPADAPKKGTVIGKVTVV
jgi:hypothetical protein